jgi:predicted pyridoxine 5'-phosphate oxidase superfamily flavin-nucleotide-binding protein
MGPYHAGEIEVQARRGVREEAELVGGIVSAEISPAAARFLLRQRMAVAASLDATGRPWASLLTGPPGFLEAVDDRLLRIAGAPPDPLLISNLAARPELGLLVLDPGTRQRMRFNGRGQASPEGLFLLADEVYGNCPKYVQRRRLVGDAGGTPGRTRSASSLSRRQWSRIEGADTFFIASFHPRGSADASHRGGRPGFVRVLDTRTLVFPDYPGNNMFNTLGNLAGCPRAGLLFVDFESGEVAQLTGGARLIWEPEPAVRVEIDEVRETPGGSPLRFELLEAWPGNPAVTPGGLPTSQG